MNSWSSLDTAVQTRDTRHWCYKVTSRLRRHCRACYTCAIDNRGSVLSLYLIEIFGVAKDFLHCLAKLLSTWECLRIILNHQLTQTPPPPTLFVLLPVQFEHRLPVACQGTCLSLPAQPAENSHKTSLLKCANWIHPCKQSEGPGFNSQHETMSVLRATPDVPYEMEQKFGWPFDIRVSPTFSAEGTVAEEDKLCRLHSATDPLLYIISFCARAYLY